MRTRRAGPPLARLAALAILALLLAGCGEVARPGGPIATPTEPIIVNAEGVPGAAGQALGPYTPESDVTIEIRTNTTIEQIIGLLIDSSAIDWDAVREAFEAAPPPIGEVTVPSLAVVMRSAATGPIGSIYVDQFGSQDWLATRALDAITGAGAFATNTDAERAVALSHLLSVELPIVRAFVAAEAGERLTEAGDLDRRFGAPHEWDRLWAILQGAPALGTVLGDELLTVIQTGAAASAVGDLDSTTAAHNAVRTALVRTALEAIGEPDRDRAIAFLRSVEPLLVRIDPQATRRLAALIEESAVLDTPAIVAVTGQLAERAGIEGSFVLVES